MRPSRPHRLFQAAGLVALGLIAARSFVGLAGLPNADAQPAWAKALLGAAFLFFGVAFLWMTRGGPAEGRTGARVVLLLVQSVVCVTTHTDLLMLLAAELPFVFRARVASYWMAAQVVLTVAVGAVLLAVGQFQGDPSLAAARPAVAIALALLTLLSWQLLFFCAGLLAVSEGRERRELARLNGELLATRDLLAASSRLSERMQISRELHDTLGHHLTVLSVHLELAKHLVAGKGMEPIAEAQEVTRLLLSDVREVVSRLREEPPLDLPGALETLAASTSEPKVELAMGEALKAAGATQAHALFRCAQEAITNAVRHARARRLWIDLTAERGGLALRVRDDGRGSDLISLGNGLRGMRERLEDAGGSLALTSGAGRGFEIRAWVPGSAEGP